ncbi:MAG TPA: glycosyltransferase family A protein [Anaerolineae bacterium]|nr:glycosyltransferase family A protein [Anaerolineae bacterium]
MLHHGKVYFVIIPSYNRSATIGKCLDAALSSHYKNFEVVVVDDCSTDDSVEVIKTYPCRLIQLNEHSGASKARNVGALHSNGEILFFTDSDCLIQGDTLATVNKAVAVHDSDRTITGGTYTTLPFDNKFFSTFQSAFVHYLFL